MKSPSWIAIMVAAMATPGLGADFGPAPQDPQVPARFQELPSELSALPTATWAVDEQPVQTFGPTAVPVALSTEVSVPVPPPPGAEQKEEFFTFDELKTEMKKLAWTKGDFRVVPYGIFWGTMAYESQETNTGDYTLYVLPPVPTTEHHFHTDVKSTRLGLDVSGPQLPWFGSAASGGRVEIDFQGSFVTENKAGLLLRHAYWEVKNEQYRLLMGQTWDVISPLYPGVLSYSVGWGGGNIGYRRAQFRGERYYALTDGLLLTAQGSLDVDIVADFPGSNVNAGDHSGWPIFEGRVAATVGPRRPGSRPIEFGVSGHIGEQIFDFYNPNANYLIPPALVANDVPERTWSFNADVRVPSGERWGVQAEFFTGENLGAFLGGILQGVNVRRAPVTQAFIAANTIRSTGGWCELWYDWKDNLHSHFGYSIDDPFNQDLTSGRTYNQFYFGNIIYDVTPRFIVGLELTQWKTLWVGQLPADSTRLEFVAKYGF